MKFVFTDGEKLGVYENGEKILLESAYIKRYKENALSSQKNKEWKKKTDTMLNDGFYEGTNESVVAQLKGVALSETVDTLVYAFTVNDSSGIYTKCYTDKEKTEAHITHAPAAAEFGGLSGKITSLEAEANEGPFNILLVIGKVYMVELLG